MDLEKKDLETDKSSSEADSDSVVSLDEHRSKLENLELELESKRLEVERLRRQLLEWEAKISEIREYVRKMEAEIASVKARSEKELHSRMNQKMANFFSHLLNIQDNLDRSLELNTDPANMAGFKEGLGLISKQMTDALKESGIEAISSKDEIFDPRFHEAVATQPVDDEEKDDIVLEELRKGYRLGDFVVRPAQVLVGKKT